MDAATLRVLEFDKIKDMLIAKCVSEIGRQYAEELSPSSHERQILLDLAKTLEAEGFIIRNGTPPLGSIYDIRAIIKRMALGASLNPAELLRVASSLLAARRLRRYGRGAAPAAGQAESTGRAPSAGHAGPAGQARRAPRSGQAPSSGQAPPATAPGGSAFAAAPRAEPSFAPARAQGGVPPNGALQGETLPNVAAPGGAFPGGTPAAEIRPSDIYPGGILPGGVAELMSGLTENHRLENRISACIISDEELADDASPALQSVRRQIRKLQDSIKDKLNDIIRSPKYQKSMQDSIVTMRQDRYVIPVKLEHKSEVSGLVHDVSASGATVFIEPMAVVETNNEIRGLRAKEQREIERILAELTGEAAEMSAELQANTDALGLLDFLFAKGKLSLDMGCTAPAISAGGRIRIKAGCHPLLAKGAAVPMDFWMDDGVSTVVVTGPNTGGKTVALKTIGLFTLMAQAGLNIPAASGSTLRAFGQVFADIGDEQSIEQSLSTFSSHMKNIVRIAASADDSTLALFDELGAGTDPAEGAAIATAILECLHQSGTCTVATTHYSELKMYALTTAGVENACCEFDVATLRPTYRLLIGVPGKSNAFAISQKLGLPDAILERAREFLSNESVAFEDVLQSIEKDRAAAEEARRRTEGARLEAERLAGELERRKRAADAQKEAILREARESAKRLLAESKADAEAILARLRKLEEEDDAQARKAEATELRHRLKSRIDKVDESLAYRMPAAASAGTGASTRPPKRLRAGDDVFLADLDQAATVVSPPDKDGNVAVRAGIITINTHISNLRAARGRGGGSGVDYGGGYGDGSDGDGNGGSRNSGGYGGGGYGGSDGDGNGGSRNGGDGEGGSRNGKARWSGDSVGGNSGWGSVGASSRADGRPPGLRALNLRAELDLRGERLEEAIARVDRYLDDAALTGLHEVTLIHGKGTGALRAGIQTFLRKHPRAKSFRNGAYGEGDLGVTVVELA